MARNDRPRSNEIFHRGEKILVGGVDSPVRAFRSVGGTPWVIEQARGAYLFDVDGHSYLDYVCSWGALILGHAHAGVMHAIQEQAALGTSFGVTTELELELATLIQKVVPFLEKIRFVSSGTEATMSAVRLARGFTKRDLILKFEGCYHGHADSFLSQAGSGLATLGIAECPGVPQALAELTLNAPYNDLGAVERSFSEHKDAIAAVIIEPIAANMGVVLPEAGFLAGLREITRRNGALLIVDEVITGFRMHYGAVQQLAGIEADLTTLGKIIGGGLPVAAYGGRAEIMTLKQLTRHGLYDEIHEKARGLVEGLREALAEAGIAGQVNATGSLATVFFAASPVRNYGDAKRSDTKRYARFFQEMLDRGI